MLCRAILCQRLFWRLVISELTMLLLYQVVLLHPVGSELIGGYSRKSGAVQTLDAEQQQQTGGYTHISRRHDVTSCLALAIVSIYAGGLMLQYLQSIPQSIY